MASKPVDFKKNYPDWDKDTLKEENAIESELDKQSAYFAANGKILATNHGYMNNQKLKRVGVQFQFTQDQMIEYAKCKNDVVYFAKNYMKIVHVDKGLIPFDMYDFQQKMARQMQNERFNLFVACRQSGKCVTGDTRIEISFLDSPITTISIANLHCIVKSINNYFNSEIYTDGIFRQQIHKDIQFNNPDAEKEFDRLWRGASYNTKKLWWERHSRQFSKINNERTSNLSQIISEDVSKWERRKVFHGVCSGLYDTHSGEYSCSNWKNISEIKRDISRRIIEKNVRLQQPILWQKTQAASKGICWQNTFKRNQVCNTTDCIEKLEVRGIQSKAEKWAYDYVGETRCSRKTSGSCNTKLGKPKSQRKTPGQNEFTRSSYENIKGKDWETAFSRTPCENKRNSQRKNLVRRVYCQAKEIINGQEKISRTLRKSTSGRIKSTNKNVPALWVDWKGWSDDSISFRQLQTEHDDKFIESFECYGFKAKTDSGFEPIYQSHLTKEFEIYKLKTENKYIECADNHIVFDKNFNEVFVKDLQPGDTIQTDAGLEIVNDIEKTDEYVNMYDIGINHANHRYYTNGILSHNSTSSVAFLLWYIIFHEWKTVAIIANKGMTAREILSRVQLAYEQLPLWMQSGIVAWNKGSIELENGCKILAAATSSSAIRGFSISTLFVDECVAGNTSVTVRDKETGDIKQIAIEELYNELEVTDGM